MVDTAALTPIHGHREYWVKRDDQFEVAGVNGGKARTCWHLAQGAKGLVTASSRHSPQANIVAHIARHLGIPCCVHTPTGQLSPEVEAAVGAGAEVVQHNAGYNSVIIARARECAVQRGWREIPFGMQCWEAVQLTSLQVENVPAEVKRIVVPVGSGMTLAGILEGLAQRGRNTNVVGICVGAAPQRRLAAFAPFGWRGRVELVESSLGYAQSAPRTVWHGLRLDSIYEAKCLPYIYTGDLLWVVGIRQTEAGAQREAQAASN